MCAIESNESTLGENVAALAAHIEEAEEIADRIGIIDRGKLLLVEDKSKLMNKMGRRQLIVYLKEKITSLPKELDQFNLELQEKGNAVVFTYDKNANRTGITRMLSALSENNIIVKDLQSYQSTLEEVFLSFIDQNKK